MPTESSSSYPRVGVSFERISQELGITSATVHNWVKTGELTLISQGMISHESYTHFVSKVVGVEKLHKRANKRQRDTHDHNSLRASIFQSISKGSIPGALLAQHYENAVSNSFKNREGVYYTPPSVVLSLFNSIPTEFSSKRFLDPCCGTGNFLVEALNQGLKPENIYGSDVDEIAVAIAAYRIKELCGEDTPINLQVGNFLEQPLPVERVIDIILTNPPWGAKIPLRERKGYASHLNLFQSSDTCSLFMKKAFEIVKPEGFVGMLLPESFFSVHSFQEIREFLLERKITFVHDYGKAFPGLVSKAVGIAIKNSACRQESIPSVRCLRKGHAYARNQTHFTSNPKSQINYHVSEAEQRALRHLFSQPHITLAGNARWALGIVTGNNHKFLSRERKPGYIPVYRGVDIFREYIKESSHYMPEDLSLYQQVAPESLYKAASKLVYRFISSRLVFYHDTEKRYFLNSANMLLPYDQFPVTTTVLCEYLNSKVINWLAASIFHSRKVLRSDLECIPIFPDILGRKSYFDEPSFLDAVGLVRNNENESYEVM